MDREVKVTIVGAGPAGIAAAIYLARAGLDPSLIERGRPGGLLRGANLVENYPGFPRGIRGDDLAGLFVKQMRRLGIGPLRESVEEVRLERGSIRIRTDSRVFKSKALIVASGSRPAELDLAGSREMAGTRFFREITEVPRRLRRDRSAIVIGGGDAAFDYALNLRGSGDRVIVVSRSEPSCLPLLRERAEARGIEIMVGWSPLAVRESGSIVVTSLASTRSRTEVTGDFVLAACGRVRNIEFLSPGIRKRMSGKAPPTTGILGLFIAGDVARGHHRQTGIAVGDGIRSAMLAHEMISGGRG